MNQPYCHTSAYEISSSSFTISNPEKTEINPVLLSLKYKRRFFNLAKDFYYLSDHHNSFYMMINKINLYIFIYY